MFTPMNMIKNCLCSHFLFIVIPVIKGNHWVIPAIIANTAPIDNT